MSDSGRAYRIGPDQFRAVEDEHVHVRTGSIEVTGSVPGMVVYGPYVHLHAGVYRVRPMVEVHDGLPAGGAGRFDVFADRRLYAHHDLWTREAILRLFETGAFELRITGVTRPLSFHGAEIEPLLLDEERVDAERAAAFGRDWIERRAEPDAVFAVVDRLIGMGEPSRAAELEQLFVSTRNRAHGLVHAALQAAHGSGPGSLRPTVLEPVTREAAEQALAGVQFRTVDLCNFFIEDRDYLLAHGYVPGFLNATRLRRTPSEPLRSWQKLPGTLEPDAGKRSAQVSRQAELDLGLQLAIARGDGAQAYCPRSGRLLTSRHGFLQQYWGIPFVLYRFEGDEIFYLCLGGATASKSFLYFPRLELIVLLQEPALRWYPPEGVVRLFRINLASNADAAREYLRTDTVPAAVYGNNNMGHFLWNDMAGLQTALERGALDGISTTVEVNRQYLPARVIFPELEAKPNAYCSDEAEAFRHCLQQRLLPVRLTEAVISERFSQRMHEAASRISTPRGQPPEKTNKPLVWINLRAHNKIWLNQTQAYIRIIEALAKDYGGLSVFFDGFSDCATMADEIRRDCGPTVTFHDGLGLPPLESLNWAYALDAYVCPIGSGLVLVSWLANKPGVAHAEHEHMQQMEWWNTVREDAVPPLTPDLSQITDVGSGLYCDYELDWRVVLALLRSILDARFAHAERAEDEPSPIPIAEDTAAARESAAANRWAGLGALRRLGMRPRSH